MLVILLRLFASLIKVIDPKIVIVARSKGILSSWNYKGILSSFKKRLITKGFTKRKGIDYHETFLLVSFKKKKLF